MVMEVAVVMELAEQEGNLGLKQTVLSLLKTTLSDCIGGSDKPPTELLLPKGGLIDYYMNNPPYYDEPKIYGFASIIKKSTEVEEYYKKLSAEISIGFAGGASLNKDKALWKVIGESIERYALFMNGRKSIKGSYNELKQQNKKLLDPNQIVYSTLKSQPKNNRNTSVDWVSGYNLSHGTKCFIPTQLIAVPYWDSGKETIWRAPITTGAATGSSIQAAIFNGLCEVIERDAFMVSWLRQLVVKRIINFKKIKSITEDKHSQLLSKTLTLLDRYKLSPEFYLLPNDTLLPTVMCILKDTTKVGPPFTVGLDTDLSIVKTMLGALEESLQLRPWVRQVHDKNISKPMMKNGKYDLYNLEQRANLWTGSAALKHLDNWLLNAEEIHMDKIKSYSSKETLKNLVNQISSLNATVYFSDLTKYTPKKVQDRKLSTVKVVIPEYQPLYLIEKYADYVRERLYSAEKRLNCKSLLTGESLQTFPHPML